MSDPNTLDRLLQSCSYRFRTVLCPRDEKLASIIVSKWQTSDDLWTSWRVVDCPLLPAGEIWCDMSCLSQLDRDPE